MGTDETLAWEARRRPRAALAAAGASVLVIASYVGSGLVFADAPRASLLSSLAQAAQPGPVGGQPSLKVSFYEFYDERSLALIASSAGRAIGFLLVGLALTFLAFATRARTDLPRIALYAPIVGGVLSAVSFLVSPIGTVAAVNDFLGGPRTVDAAREVVSSSLVVAAGLIGFVGGGALAVGFVLVCLAAMRAGLLTRFMGVLGMLAGALTFIPIGSPLPIVQCFWLAALALLFTGRWPSGQPPAWTTGRAEPWPTQQQIREQRDRAKAPEPGKAPDPAPRREQVAAGAHPSSRKRKRKPRT